MELRRGFRVAVGIAVVLTLALGVGASSYGPAPTTTWVVSGGVSGGTVEAVAISGSTAYLGGDFGYMGPETGSFVSLDSTSGQLNSPWPLVGGSVNALVSDGSGGWYIGGSFSSIGTAHADNLAHVKADGTLDTAFTAGTDGSVYALAASAQTLYVGGAFTHAGGSARAGLAAFDRGTAALTAFNAGVTGTDPFVSALELSGTTLYVGGWFSNLGGQQRQNLGAVATGTGATTGWSPSTNDIVNTIAVDGSGTVYVGGFFTIVNGVSPHKLLAAFNPSTGAALSWDPGLDSGVNSSVDAVDSIEINGSTLYVGGAFENVGAQTRDGLASFDLTASPPTLKPWRPILNGAVYQLAFSGSTVYAAGSFQNVNNNPTDWDNVAAFNDTTGSPVPGWSPVVGGDVFALGVSGTKVALGGAFRTAPTASETPVRRDNLAALDLATGLAKTWNPRANKTVFTLAVSGSAVYAGGAFTTVNGGVARNHLASFDLSLSGVTSWNPNVNDTVFTLALAGATVYAGGSFTTANVNLTRNHAAAFTSSGAGTAIPNWNPNANGAVFALDAWDNVVYMGGDFTSLGATGRTRLAAVDVNGTIQPWNPLANDTVFALAHAGTTEYAGGSFTLVNGNVPRGAAAAFDATSGAAAGWDPSLALTGGGGGIVISLAPTASTMYLGGLFHTAGDCASSCVFAPEVAAVGLADGDPLATWQPVPDAAVNALGVATQGLVVGGTFTALGYPPAGTPYNQVEPGATYRGGVALVRALPDAPSASATPGDASATVTVTAPSYLGGGGSPSYTVTASPGGQTASGPGPFTFSGLTNGLPYTFSATATTSAGTGPAGVSSPVVPRTVPGAPTDVTAVPGDITASVSFTPPVSDGGDPITSYTVTSTPGNVTRSGPSSPVTVTGLHNGTSYTFTVKAQNGAGFGPDSTPSAPVVPLEGGRPHPSAPEGLPRTSVPEPAAPSIRPDVPHQG